MMKRYVTGFMVSTDRKKVALIAKRRPAWQAGYLNGVGGKIEPGETPAEAMAREFAEETGVRTESVAWRPFVILTRQGDYQVNFLFTIDDRIDAVTSREDEVVGLYEIEDLPGNVVSNLRWLIPMACDPNLRFETPAEIAEERPEQMSGAQRPSSRA